MHVKHEHTLYMLYIYLKESMKMCPYSVVHQYAVVHVH